jgi:hypothetical protein
VTVPRPLIIEFGNEGYQFRIILGLSDFLDGSSIHSGNIVFIQIQ